MKRKRPAILFSFLVLLMLFTGFSFPGRFSLLFKLEGYWHYEQIPALSGAGFVHISQEGNHISMRSITENGYVYEENFAIEELGLVHIEEVFFNHGITLLSDEILPEVTYTVINKKVADIKHNEMIIFQEFDTILHEGVEKSPYEEDIVCKYRRASHPDFTLMSVCHKFNDSHVIEGSAYIDHEHVGTIIF
ncbi:MAG TPA: hypothetical protein P5107_08630 [Thermotogota bacterium]|nr:hypothetical protein [Thermotogota bacterium]HRW35107.1 hypothetical protein [Thermotogota bacterium]